MNSNLAYKNNEKYDENIINSLINNLVDSDYGENNKIYVVKFNNTPNFVFESYTSLVDAVKRALNIKGSKILNKGNEIKFREIGNRVIYIDKLKNKVGEIML